MKNKVSNNIFKSDGEIGFGKTKEIWLPITGYEGIYEISNKKRIKALEKIIIGGRYNCPRKFKEKILSTKIGDVVLVKDKKNKTFNIETLYQIIFNDFKPKGDRKKCIIDGDIVSRRSFVQSIKIKKADKTSKYVGVHWAENAGKWRSNICIDKKDIHLGLFKNENDANIIYKKAVEYEYLYKGIPKLFRELLNNVILGGEKNIITE